MKNNNDEWEKGGLRHGAQHLKKSNFCSNDLLTATFCVIVIVCIIFSSIMFCKFLIQPVWRHWVKGVRGQVLTIQINQSSSEQSVDHLQFAIAYWWIIPAILFLKYLFINTYKAMPCHLGFQSELLDHRLVKFTLHKYRLQFENSKPVGILMLPLSYAPLTGFFIIFLEKEPSQMTSRK